MAMLLGSYGVFEPALKTQQQEGIAEKDEKEHGKDVSFALSASSEEAPETSPRSVISIESSVRESPDVSISSNAESSHEHSPSVFSSANSAENPHNTSAEERLNLGISAIAAAGVAQTRTISKKSAYSSDVKDAKVNFELHNEQPGHTFMEWVHGSNSGQIWGAPAPKSPSNKVVDELKAEILFMKKEMKEFEATKQKEVDAMKQSIESLKLMCSNLLQVNTMMMTKVTQLESKFDAARAVSSY